MTSSAPTPTDEGLPGPQRAEKITAGIPKVTPREAFAPGVLLGLEKIRDLPPGLTVGLEALL